MSVITEALTKFGPKAASLLGLTGEAFKEAPVLSSLNAVGLGMGAADIFSPVGDAAYQTVSGNQGKSIQASVSAQNALSTFQRVQAARQEILRRKQAENEALLAQQNPALYTSVLAGRKLPRGAVVIGGRPRRDLMSRLTEMMSTGEMAGPPV